MNSEMYVIYQGMRARQRTLDVIANNIANASTSGFKADRTLYRSYEAAQREAETAAQNPNGGGVNANTQTINATTTTAVQSDASQAKDGAQLLSQSGEMNIVTGGMVDFTQGSLRQTGRTLDAAIDGDGFFVVQTARGERYTRAGSFTLDAAGQLVTQNGELIVGGGGAITVPPGEVSIGPDGTLSVAGQRVDRLKIVRFDHPQTSLTKEGASLFAANNGVRPREDNNSTIEQGSLETSNVNTITEMAAMMQNGREFDSLQRSISMMMNELGRKVSSELGKI